MATEDINAQWGSMIVASDEGSDYGLNTPVTNWTKTDEFILAIEAYYTDPWNKNTNSAQVSLEYNINGGGTWYPVSSGNHIQPGTGTSLVDGVANTRRLSAADPPAGCSGSYEDGLEVENANARSAAFTNVSEGWCELHFALDPQNAVDGNTYGFRLYNYSISTAFSGGTIPAHATIQMATGEVDTIPIFQSYYARRRKA